MATAVHPRSDLELLDRPDTARSGRVDADAAPRSTTDATRPGSSSWSSRLRVLRDLLVVAAILLAVWVTFGPGRGARDDLGETNGLIRRQVRVSERLEERADRSLAIAEQGLRIGTEARDIGREALGVGKQTRVDVARQVGISERLRDLAEANDRRAAAAVALAEETLRTAQLTGQQAGQLLALTTELRDAAVPTAADVDRLIGLVESITGPLPPSSTPPPAG